MHRYLDKTGTNLGLVSQYCPHFVHLQGDQVENGKNDSPSFVQYLSSPFFMDSGDQRRTKVRHFFRPMRTKTSPDQDKTEN